ncbi:CpsD/CapB family tyrosine-protein kinase [Cereibacter sphaeroides]|uniref:CpsD/CapB family tyrosine-protein kinase n=1 Tax=Cereibacter sphaeroides TaxID=1063 RepID=UPI001F2D7D42|nr:CpsD/CapB family tyrosine-protein kinase [Cereibacter sphaeroides]MCE6958706.1 CpsD/CapB family tyrosine-protein kinase [Cereibacter sphaeroides]MCE6973411.1 CpsD/CapB family tyrosine-protein kinase [Cereibacter sphaeroides]
MERIQTAIAKARAARGDKGGSGGRMPSPFAADRPLAPEQVAEAWQALSEVAPSPHHFSRHHVVAGRGGKESAPFDVMRTKLLHQMRAQGWRRVAITSPGAGCGKSTIALNLALSLARQPELRILLVELDLRRPSLARMLGLTDGHNFAEVLRDSAVFEDHAVRIGANLAIATNRQPVRNPSELLQGASVPGALAGIEARYAPDVVIFDLPPLLVSDDTLAVADLVDCALLIAAAESTSAQEVDLCERELAERTNVLGVVLNKCRYMESGYGYSHYG